ncbi:MULTISPECIES: helicase HerA domain-containing protein [Acidobacteriaceae]|uniref:helicase HerA domain-containing protein n=1 Tax=Acidobacteriaceae TaxID=204434 RepID=UPI001C20439A|nr:MULTISPECIES: DUF87 domain-containing protein [Acidobacteriaceae]MDW5266670.1 DUF87 domain-containing protein [Edaphobacter sp.]
MNQLILAIAEEVRDTVSRQLGDLSSENAQLRAVFNGPPAELLREVFGLLTQDGGIRTPLSNGSETLVPVLMVVTDLPVGSQNPPVGSSGLCDQNHILNVRNSPQCPRFIVLSPPGNQTNLSQNTTWFDCGVAPQNNAGNVQITSWWQDDFVQRLTLQALRRFPWDNETSMEGARKLIAEAVFAADSAERHGGDRRAAWKVLSRIWSIDPTRSDFGRLVSLATGFPPAGDNVINSTQQIKALTELAERLEDGFRPTFELLKTRAADDDEQQALDELLSQLQARCPVPTAVTQGMAFYYGPGTGDVLPDESAWWRLLTLDRWQDLLEEDVASPEALSVKCTNSIAPAQASKVPVVKDIIELEITVPSTDKNVTAAVEISREGVPVNQRRRWTIHVSDKLVWLDDEVPEHKRPIKYVISSPGMKSSSIHVISMAHWEPGIIVSGRNARKAPPPKAPRTAADKVTLESYLELHAQGRHYLDVYVRPGFELEDIATGTDNSDSASTDKDEATVVKIADGEYGLEVRAGIDTSYELKYFRGNSAAPSKLKIYLTCNDEPAEQCNSEFERLILLNKTRKDKQLTSSVHVNRIHRSADLQSWMLAKEHSYYPLVFGPDYADNWRSRNWSSQEDTILSRGRFLSDPRPTMAEMTPPEGFLAARKLISGKIRAEEEGLIEGAPLGEWLANDTSFEEALDSYVHAYGEWLEQAPEIASWCDVSIVTALGSDQQTLAQEPDALLISPLHPLRLAWHALAQRTLIFSHRKRPCPAASIMDPRCVPDVLTLHLRTPTGDIEERVFFSVECTSDFWSVLWNSTRADQIGATIARTPFNTEFGVQIGGLSSSFSVSQVKRSLTDIAQLLSAKAMLNVSITSASSQNSSTNDGLIDWCRSEYSKISEESVSLAVGKKSVRILDQRKSDHRPEDAEISNLAEDTQNSVSWYASTEIREHRPDLTIVAQLETTEMKAAKSTMLSPMAAGGLFRVRIRQQLMAGSGAFLSESRMGMAPSSTGDGLLDRTAGILARLESIGTNRYSYVFAPSVHTLQASLNNSRYVAVSSASVDPACFLGGWLTDTYLWDYDLPSYSSRAGDSNGYYLLAQITDVDRDTLADVVQKLPDAEKLTKERADNLILEVARRGIPTVRGLSSGDSGAVGDLGLFVAARLLQDEFRMGENSLSLFPVWREDEGVTSINLLVPVDPFRSYLDDLTRAVSKAAHHRPDLLLLSLNFDATRVFVKLTPIEVKYRNTTEPLSVNDCLAALGQAKSLVALLEQIEKIAGEDDMLMWRLASKHFYAALLDYGFRVYSQQSAVIHRGAQWANCHAKVMTALMTGELQVEVDTRGRLIAIDGSTNSVTRDTDNDGFHETISLSRKDATEIISGDSQAIYAAIRAKISTWETEPRKRLPTKLLTTDTPTTGGEVLPQNARVNDMPDVQEQPVIVELLTIEHPSVLDVSEVPVDQPDVVAVSRGIELLIGDPLDAFRPETRSLSLSDTNLNQLNIGVVGDLGTGKTQLLKSLIYQITTQTEENMGVSPNILILDYKKDYSNDEFVKATNAKVIRPKNLRLNLFDVSQASESTTPWLDRFSFFADVLDKIYSGIGPVQRKVLKDAVRAAYAEKKDTGIAPTIYDVHRLYQVATNNKADSVSSIIEDLVDRELFAADATEASTKEFLTGVVVISLDALGQDDKSKNMLVAVLLNLFYENMLKIPKRPFYGADPQKRVVDSFLLVDEADNIMKYEFDVLRKVLLQGREFGVGVILASQYLRHFKVGATDYREPLLTWLIHKVPNVLPQELSALGMTANMTQTADRIKSLALHECMYKTFNVNGEFLKGMPFYRLVKS